MDKYRQLLDLAIENIWNDQPLTKEDCFNLYVHIFTLSSAIKDENELMLDYLDQKIKWFFDQINKYSDNQIEIFRSHSENPLLRVPGMLTLGMCYELSKTNTIYKKLFDDLNLEQIKKKWQKLMVLLKNVFAYVDRSYIKKNKLPKIENRLQLLAHQNGMSYIL